MILLHFDIYDRDSQAGPHGAPEDVRDDKYPQRVDAYAIEVDDERQTARGPSADRVADRRLPRVSPLAPLNSKSEVHLRRLGETVGLQRTVVTMARVPRE